MKKKKIVIALGHEALGTTLPEQKEATKRTAKAVADFIREDYQVVITHSNGPQIGMIHTAMNEFCKLYPEYTATPMSVCSAMSQGYIGYDLQNAIRAELLNKGIYKPVSTILTQVVVDPYDEAFYKPSKVIGRVLTEEEAEAEEKKGNHVVKTEGGYRRIVAAPKPMDIVEIDAVKALSDADQIVVACGGGGIPVLMQDNNLKGASAVIEKDLAAGKLAELLDADMLVILTSVDNVCLNYGQPDEKPLSTMTVAEAKKYMEQGQFGEGDMLPKIEAAINFIALLGWAPSGEYNEQEIFSMDELKKAFEISGISKSPAIFDDKKLRAINGAYVHKMDPAEFAKAAEPYIRETVKRTDIDMALLCSVLQNRTEVFSDIPEQVDFIDAMPEYDLEMYRHKKMKTTPETALDALKETLPVLEGVSEWDVEHIHEALFAKIADLGVKNGWMLWPLRTAVSGKQFTPGGGVELCAILGKEDTLARIRKAIDALSA